MSKADNEPSRELARTHFVRRAVRKEDNRPLRAPDGVHTRMPEQLSVFQVVCQLYPQH